MDEQKTTRDKRPFWRNDPLLVCGMSVVYGICILALLGGVFWGLDQRSKRISADITLTASALAVQENATATANSYATEQATVGFTETFNDKSLYWPVGPLNGEYSTGSTAIADGLYVWDIHEIKKPFVQWEIFQGGNQIRNFNISIDSKMADNTARNTCNGFGFRTASDVNQGAYTFLICKSSYFHVNYYERGEWEAISGEKYSSAIHAFDWNRIEINAQGSHLTFRVNDETVFDAVDDRLSSGGLALLVEVNDDEPVIVWFDNFWFQSR